MKQSLPVLIGFMLYVTHSVAAVTTLDFEEYFDTVSNDIVSTAGLESNGFVFTSAGELVLAGRGSSGSSSLVALKNYGETTFFMFGGDFQLASFDVLGYAEPSFAGDIDLTIVGSRAGGISVDVLIPYVEFDMPEDSFTVNLGGIFSSVQSVTILSTYDLVIDNIVVATVPLPASAWLMISAFGGLFTARWRRAAQPNF